MVHRHGPPVPFRDLNRNQIDAEWPIRSPALVGQSPLKKASLLLPCEALQRSAVVSTGPASHLDEVVGLRPAHHGYLHQDICTAYLLALALVRDDGPVTVDQKVVPDDRFDDVALEREGQRIRLQIKASIDPDKPIAERNFSTEATQTRFDLLVGTFLANSPPADEYKLCVTWRHPEQTDPLHQLWDPVEGSSVFEGLYSSLYRLRGDALWPVNGSPIWPTLDPDLVDDGTVQRLIEETTWGGCQIVVGSPGSGKSWLLTQVADRLRDGGVLVARHYCHLDPLDSDRASRSTRTAPHGSPMM